MCWLWWPCCVALAVGAAPTRARASSAIQMDVQFQFLEEDMESITRARSQSESTLLEYSRLAKGHFGKDERRALLEEYQVAMLLIANAVAELEERVRSIQASFCTEALASGQDFPDCTGVIATSFSGREGEEENNEETAAPTAAPAMLEQHNKATRTRFARNLHDAALVRREVEHRSARASSLLERDNMQESGYTADNSVVADGIVSAGAPGPKGEPGPPGRNGPRPIMKQTSLQPQTFAILIGIVLAFNVALCAAGYKEVWEEQDLLSGQFHGHIHPVTQESAFGDKDGDGLVDDD